MYNEQGSNLIITNCVYTDNSARIGGGMSNYKSSPRVISCTFSGNSADYGGGMDNYVGSNPTVSNCILWGNTATSAGNDILDQFSSPVISYSDIGGGYPGMGNIDSNPLFVDSVAGDFRISPGSPCVDTGDNSAPSLPSTDILDNPRIVDGDCNSVATVDMGAYEFDWLYLGDLEGDDCDVDFGDFGVLGQNWLLDNPAIDIAPFAEPDGIIDLRELVIVCGNWLEGK
jgi:hypothetical protein